MGLLKIDWVVCATDSQDEELMHSELGSALKDDGTMVLEGICPLLCWNGPQIRRVLRIYSRPSPPQARLALSSLLATSGSCGLRSESESATLYCRILAERRVAAAGG